MVATDLFKRRYAALPSEVKAPSVETVLMLAVAVSSFMGGYNLTSWAFVISAVLLMSRFLWLQLKAPRAEVASLLLVMVIIGSGVVSVMLRKSASEPWEATAVLLAYPALFCVILMIRPSREFLNWLVPVALVHSVVIFVQFVTLTVAAPNGYRPTGITDSANPAGGFLVLIALVVLPTKWWPLAIPMAIALAMTGSRLSVIALIVGGVFTLWSARPSLMRLAVVAVVSVGVVVAMDAHIDLVQRGLDFKSQVEFRLTPEAKLSLSPTGVNADVERPIHSLFYIVAAQYGLLAFLALCVLVLIAVIRQVTTRQFPLLCTLIVLASLDLYLWIGPMAWAWWWALSWRPPPIPPPRWPAVEAYPEHPNRPKIFHRDLS